MAHPAIPIRPWGLRYIPTFPFPVTFPARCDPASSLSGFVHFRTKRRTQCVEISEILGANYSRVGTPPAGLPHSEFVPFTRPVPLTTAAARPVPVSVPVRVPSALYHRGAAAFLCAFPLSAFPPYNGPQTQIERTRPVSVPVPVGERSRPVAAAFIVWRSLWRFLCAVRVCVRFHVRKRPRPVTGRFRAIVATFAAARG